MSITKLYYSDITDCVYLDEKEAQCAENLAIQLTTEFDELRNEYNLEHEKLRNKYQDQFDAILDKMKSLKNK